MGSIFSGANNPGLDLNPLTTAEFNFITSLSGLAYQEGDLLYYHSGALTRLPIGTSGDVLTVTAGDPVWGTAGVIGLTPGSVAFAGSTGALTQDNGGFFYDPVNHELIINGRDTVSANGLTFLEIFHDMDVTEPTGANDIGYPVSSLSTFRGTYTSPTINSSGDVIGEYRWYGVTTGPTFSVFAAERGTVSGSTSGNPGGTYGIYTKADGGALSERLHIDNAGLISIPTKGASLSFSGGTSGTTLLVPTATASGTLTLPAATDTLIGKATTDTLTNKTFDTAGTGNSFSINGVAVTANTGTGAVVRTSSPTLVTASLGSSVATTQTQLDGSTKVATTSYVDTAVSNAVSGINPAVSVSAATTSSGNTSTWTYNNGASGIGATFTGPTNTAITIDGFTFTTITIQSLLIKNDTQSPSGAFNGVYVLTALQTVGTGAIFTRRLDYDQPSDINSSGAIPVINGTANASTSWVQTANIGTVGVTPLTFVQFGINPSSVVTAVSVATANGFSGSSSGGTTPALTIVAGAITPTTVNGLTVTTTAGTLTIANSASASLITSGNFALTLTATAATNATFPSGTSTLVNTAVATLSSLTSVGTITTGGLGTGATLGAVTVNIASSAVGDLHYLGSSNVLTRLADVAAGQPLLSGGVTTAPAYAGYTFSATASQTYTFPGATATLAGLATAQTFTGQDKFNNIIDVNNAIAASSNAATVPVTFRLNTVTNSSAATLTITMTTTSAVDGQMTIVRVLDFSGVAETITWVNTENSTVTAPTTSNGSTTLFLTVGFIYNGGTSKWRCIASA